MPMPARRKQAAQRALALFSPYSVIVADTNGVTLDAEFSLPQREESGCKECPTNRADVLLKGVRQRLRQRCEGLLPSRGQAASVRQ